MAAGRGKERRARAPVRARAAEADRAIDAIRSRPPRGVVVVAAPGDGQSPVLEAAVTESSRRGLATIAVTATPGTAAVPLGALAPALAAVVDPSALTPDPAGVAHSARALERLAGSQPPAALRVDDAHRLDPLSAAVITQATRDGTIVPVLSMDATTAGPPELHPLWEQGLVERIDLAPLTPAEAASAVAESVEGPVDAAVLAGLIRLVGPRPSRLASALDHNIDTGAVGLLQGMWRQHAPLTLPPFLLDQTMADLGARVPGIQAPGATDDATLGPLLAVLALVEELPIDLLAEAFGTEAARYAERAGVLAERTTGHGLQASLADAAHGTALRLRAPHLDLVLGAAEVLRVLEGRVAAGRSDADPVLRAVLSAEVGRDLGPQEALAVAREAATQQRYEIAERLCRVCLRDGPEPEASLLLGDVLMYEGRSSEADRELAGCDPHDDQQRAMRAMARAANLLLRLDDPQHAAAILDEALSGLPSTSLLAAEVAAQRDVVALFTEGPNAVLAHLDPGSLAPRNAEDRGFAEVATAAAPAMLVAGRCEEAADLAQQACDHRLALGGQQVLAPAAVHLVSRSLALAVAGSLSEAAELGELIAEGAAQMDHREGQAWGGIATGWALLPTGRSQQAEERFRSAFAAAVSSTLVPHMRWAAAGVVLSVAQRGDPGSTGDALALLDSCPAGPTVLMAPEQSRARAWAAVVVRSDPFAHLDRAAELAWATGQWSLALLALHDRIRLGDTGSVGRLLDAADRVQGPLAQVCAAHGRALQHQDPEGLADASEGFAALGADLPAAEAAMQGAVAARLAGDRATAGALAAAARGHHARCQDASTPALARHPGLAELTAREHEVVGRAADGLRSKEIAAELGVSVRTVDNLLQRAYRKLAVASRDELRRVLDP